MRRSCNLELRLVPPSAALPPPDYPGENHLLLQPMFEFSSRSRKEEQQQQQQKQLTIFYNGRISVCDVTEFQARAIVMLASGEMEENMKTLLGSAESELRSLVSPLLQSPLCSPTAGVSMKRSLQRFLQKRRNRIEAASPYNR